MTGQDPRPLEEQPAAAADLRPTVGVRFTPTGRTLLCAAPPQPLRPGDLVMIDDRRGGAVATVSVPTTMRAVAGPLPKVLRRATPQDQARLAEDRRRGDDALAFARERARARAMDIKLFRVELGARGERALFYFAAEHRVDFRDLVRDLAAQLRTRIEMRQVGVRDEAKMVGGIGSCGLELCCTTFLPRFEPVSIRMAKHQNLALNPAKVSGQCGRLKCCLVYEDAQYVEAAKNLPKLGKQVDTPEGIGRVQDLDILRGQIRVHFPDRAPVTFTADQVRRLGPSGSDAPAVPTDSDPDAP